MVSMPIILLSLYATKKQKIKWDGGDKNKLIILCIRNLVSNP